MASNTEPELPPDLCQELDVGETEAWQRLLRLLLPVAMRALRERFGLIQLYGGDETVAEAALWSAWSSFQRHYLDGEFEDIRDLEELAGHFIRIAYNRWQRAWRQQRRMNRALEEGIVRDGSGQATPRDFEDAFPGPAEAVTAHEFTAYLWQAVDTVKGELSPKALRTVQVWLQDLRAGRNRNQLEMAQELCVTQPTVSRHLEGFFDRVRELLEESGEM